jgi:hypothetical protein
MEIVVGIVAAFGLLILMTSRWFWIITLCLTVPILLGLLTQGMH